MSGAQRKKLRDVLAEQQFLDSIGASVPQGAPMGQEFAAPDLTMDDYARFGIDPSTMQGSGEMPLLPDALVQAALKGEDALTGDIAQDYMDTTGEAFMGGVKKIARGYGQKWDQPDGLSGMTAWEAQRNDPGNVDGNLDKYSNRDWSGNLNIANGLIEAMSAPAAPLFGPVFETGLKQAGVENGNVADTMLGRNFVEPVAEMTGIEPQAIFDTTLNATMAAPFAKQIGRAANKGAHKTLDVIDNATGMSELFKEDLLPENRTAKNLPRRFGNTLSEVFGRDDSDPGIQAPWLTSAPRAQGELSPWLQDNLDLDTPPIDQPSLETRNSGGGPVRPSTQLEQRGLISDPNDPAFFTDLFAESNRRDRGLLPPEPGSRGFDQVAGDAGGPMAAEVILDRQRQAQQEVSDAIAALNDLYERRSAGEDVQRYFSGAHAALRDAQARAREAHGETDPAMTGPIPDAAFGERTTLDQVPDINSNQGPNGGLYESSMSPFMRRLGYTHELDNVPAPQGESALLREDASRNIVDDMIEEFPETQFESPNPMPWSGAYNPAARATADFRQSREAPDWEAHGIGVNDPARQAYERQRLIMAEMARDSMVDPAVMTFDEYLFDFHGLSRERYNALSQHERTSLRSQYESRTQRLDAADTNRQAGGGGAPRTDAEVMNTVRRIFDEDSWNALPTVQRDAIMAGIRGNVPEHQRNLMLQNLDDAQAEGLRRARALQANGGRIPDSERSITPPRGHFGRSHDAFPQEGTRPSDRQLSSNRLPPEMRALVERYDEKAFGDFLRNEPPPDWNALGFDENHPARQAYENVIREQTERDINVRATGRNMLSLPRERYAGLKRVETDLARDREALRSFMGRENYTDQQVNTLSRTAADSMLSRMRYADETRARLRDVLIARGQPEARLNAMTYNELLDLDRTIGRDGAAIRTDGEDLVRDQGVDAVREQVRPFMTNRQNPARWSNQNVDNAPVGAIRHAADAKQNAIVEGNRKYDEIETRRKNADARRKAAANATSKEPVTTLDTTGKPVTTFPDGGVLSQVRETGGKDYKHYLYKYESPFLPTKVDLSFSVDKDGRADIAIGGEWEANRGILGPAVVRDIARHLKKSLGAKKFAGTRVTGVRAGKGIEQNVRFSGVPAPMKPSAKKRQEKNLRQTIEEAVKTNGYRREGDVTTFADGSTLNHVTDYSYAGPYRMAIFEYKKPGMENSVEIELRINKDEGRADVSILGDNEHINAFGTGTIRNMQRYFKNEYGVKQFDGYRVTGANPKREISIRGSGAAPEKPSAKARKEAREKAKKKARQSPLSNDEFLAQAATPVEMFDRHTKGGVGRGDQGARDGILSTPNLRDLTPEEAASIARKNPHLRQDKSGQYIGGPRGVKTSRQIKKMRERFDAEVEKGLIGAQWYSRAREANVRNNSGKERQSLAAKEQAQMSAQATPDTNMNWAIQLRNDYEAGIPSSKAKTGRQADTYLRARTEGIGMGHNSAERLQDRLGKKTGIYGEHLDPNVPFATTGTNDIWHARGFGYTNNDGSMFSRALTAQEHRFLDYETVLAADRANKRKMGGRSDWTAAEIQAAPWVALKGASLAKKHNKGKAVKSGKRPAMSEAEGIAKAGETYPDLEDKYTANVTRESWPSQGMQMFPEWDMSKATAQERADWDAMAPYLDEGGRDPTYSQTFGLQTRPSQKAIGSFEGQNNPVTISRPLVNFEKEGGKTRVGATSRSMLDMESAASGLMDFQDGSAWNKIVTHGDSGKDRSSVSIDIGRSPSMDEMQALEAIATKYGFSLANANNGASFLDLTGVDAKTAGSRIKKGMKAEIEKAVGGPAKVERGRLESGYHDLSKELLPENAGKGLATRKTLTAIDEAAQGAPNAKNSLLHSKEQQAKAAASLKRILEMEKTKGNARADVTKLLDILARGGWKGLYNYVQRMGTQGLPAVALPLLLMEKREQQDDLSNVDMSTY